MEFGEKIAVLRKERGMTQAELGAELNVTFQAVSKWERGESFPDFATMSKIAKLFGVPLTYFEDNETAATAEGAAQADGEKQEPAPEMIGVCTSCGMVVYSGQEGRASPSLVCKKCCDREKAAELRRRQEAERQKVEQKKRAELAENAAIAAKRSKRNSGLIAGGIAAAIVLIIAIVSAIFSDSTGAVIGGGVAVTLMTFTFLSQLIWGGIVRSVCFAGGAMIGTPGVIFTLDLDGVFFLVAAKIFFALLKLFIFIITSLFMVFAAFVISPFAFIPRLVKMSSATPLED
ncbi:MAG: helix-turn-helix transcriptional regulator [Clostridiales bacterium]|nr:helix-turn-helix transcriptional regulator [Clostridiales bacterium]